MQREEKQLESSLDTLIGQVSDIKNSLASFIYKLENEYDRLTWPSVLDNFALLSGQLSTLNKVLKNDKTPLLKNQVIIPLLLSPDRDEEIMRLTEGRVPVFSHEVVPDHLRTKPDPEVEDQEKQLSTEAARLTPEVAQKQVQNMNKLCNNLVEKILKEERESESAASLRQNKPTYNPADTNALVAAVAFGKGLSNRRPAGPGGPMGPGQAGASGMLQGSAPMQQVTMSMAPNQQQHMPGVQMAQAGQPGKIPSSIKTNIKSASMHPYQR